jgi:hypothetical protein
MTEVQDNDSSTKWSYLHATQPGDTTIFRIRDPLRHIASLHKRRVGITERVCVTRDFHLIFVTNHLGIC